MSCHLHNSIPKIDGVFSLLSDPKIKMLTAKRDVTPMSWVVMVRFTSLFWRSLVMSDINAIVLHTANTHETCFSDQMRHAKPSNPTVAFGPTAPGNI